MRKTILFQVLLVSAFTCGTLHASGVFYSPKPNPDQLVSVPADTTTVSYFDAETIAPPDNNDSLVAGVNNSAATPNNEFVLHNISPAIAVPEPSSLILTGFGLVGLLINSCCRKSQSKANA